MTGVISGVVAFLVTLIAWFTSWKVLGWLLEKQKEWWLRKERRGRRGE
jgi:predicted permease